MRKSNLLVVVFAFLVLMTSVISVKAEIFSGGFTWSTVTYVCEDGVSTTDCNIIREGAERWNYMSSKRNMKYNNTKDSYGQYNAHVKASTNYPQSNPSILGEIIPGMGCTLLSGCRKAGVNDTWTSAYLRIYKKNFPTANQTNYLRKTTVHEFGHINSMAHTNKESVMRQGLSTDYLPKSFDKTEMIRKWGK